MQDAFVYLAGALFFISIFPVHLINYVYISTENNYVSVNVTLYRIFTIFNFNTQKAREKKPGKYKKRKVITAKNWLQLYNKLCITKVIQLADFGIADGKNAYAALAQTAVTDALYTFIKINGERTKLKNYTVLNYEHNDINYYLKFSGIINVITLVRLFITFIRGKLNEHKVKETK